MLCSGGVDVVKPVFVATVASSLVYAAVPYVVLQKVCSPDGVPKSINDFKCNDEELTALATTIATTRTSVGSVCAALALPLFGAWRDATDRSLPLLLIGQAAEILVALIYLLAAWFWGSSAWIAVVVSAALGGFFGQNILFLGANCLVIKNATSARQRVIKLQIYLLSLGLATVVGDTASGPLLTAVGYVYYYLVVVLLMAAALFWTQVTVKEPKTSRGLGFAAALARFKVPFRARPNNTVVWLMLVSNALITAYIAAEGGVIVYYTQHAFNFSVNQSTIYLAYHTLLCIAGSIIIPKMLVKFLNWRLFKIGLSSTVMTTIAGVAFPFVKNTVELYLVALLDVLKYVVMAIPQSVLSLCVKNNELGLFLGLGGIAGIGLPILLNFLYSYTSTHYRQTMPGAIFFISAGVNVVLTMLLGIGHLLFVPPPEETDDCESQPEANTEEEPEATRQP